MLLIKNKIISSFWIIFFSVFATSAKAQFVQDTSKKVQYLLIPVLFKTPEMGLAYGLSGSISFKTSNKHDSLTRTSVIQTIGFFTTRKQNIQAVDASIYFPKENYIFLFQSTHSYFPDRFWGIGPNTLDIPGEKYSFEQFYFGPQLKRKIFNHLYIGALYQFQTVYKQNYIKGGIFDTSAFVGKNEYHVSGAGLSLSYDSRDLSFWPSKGMYFFSELVDYRKAFFSDYKLVKWVTDLRYFKKLYKAHIMAFQLYNYQTFGNTPLKELAAFGGQNNMRGFYQGRFRAENMVSFITEYRTTIYKRFSACAFWGLGNVYTKPSDINKDNIKYSWGGGLRFALLEKEKLNLRLDYGYSNNFNRAFYFTVAECF